MLQQHHPREEDDARGTRPPIGPVRMVVAASSNQHKGKEEHSRPAQKCACVSIHLFQSSAIKCSKYDVVFTFSSCIYRFISKTAYYKPIRMPQSLKPEPLAPSNYSLVEVPTTGRRCSNKALCIGSFVAARLCARLNWFASLNL